MRRSGDGRSALLALTLRELVRFARQPSRIIGSIGTPAIIWLLAGSGLAGSFVSPIADETTRAGAANAYAAYLIPGMATMVVIFGTIFASISLIQDRHAGFLQSVLVSPAPTWAIVGSKVGGAVILSVLQGLIVLLAAPLVGVHPGVLGYLIATLALALAAVFVTCLGLTLAWRMDSVAGFHGVMNLVLLPMWILSGSMFPLEGTASWLHWIVRLNPLGWSTRAIGGSLGTGNAGFLEWVGAPLAAAASFGLAWVVIGRRRVRTSGTEGAS